MSAFSNWLETRIVSFWLQGSDLAPPGNVYLALFTADPTEEGLTANETTYTNYARQQANWTSLDGNGQTKNSGVITFPANGNSSASVTITHAAIFDALTTGNMLLYGPLASSKTLAPGDVLSFAANALTLTIN